jgi:hypothetical protein
MISNSTGFGLTITPLAGTMIMQRPSAEELTAAKRWVDEQKKIAFARSWSYSVQVGSAFLKCSFLPQTAMGLPTIPRS